MLVADSKRTYVGGRAAGVLPFGTPQLYQLTMINFLIRLYLDEIFDELQLGQQAAKNRP